MIKRLAFGLLATAAFVVVPAAGAAAGELIPRGEVLPDTCEVACEIGEACFGNDENVDGRVCTPFGQSELVKAITTAVDHNL